MGVAFVDVDGHRVFGHIRVVESVATGAGITEPGLQATVVLAQPVEQHGGALGQRRGVVWRGRAVGCPGVPRPIRKTVVGGHLEQQELHIDGAVVEPVAFVAAQPDGTAQFNIPSQDTRPPALKLSMQHLPQFLVQQRHRLSFTETLTPGWVADQQTAGHSPMTGPHQFIQRLGTYPNQGL